MATEADAKDLWVRNVLGIDPRAALAAQNRVKPGTVAYRKALLGFSKAKAQVWSQFDQFTSALAKELPEEATLAKQVSDQLAKLNNEIGAVVDHALNASGGADDKVRSKIEAYAARLAGDPLIEHLDDNPFVSLSIKSTLSGALQDILGSAR